MLQSLYQEISDQVNADAAEKREAASTPHSRIMAMVDALLDLSTRPRRGVFLAQLNPMLSPVLQPVLGQSSGHYVEIRRKTSGRRLNNPRHHKT
jgi:hypothetical protein